MPGRSVSALSFDGYEQALARLAPGCYFWRRSQLGGIQAANVHFKLRESAMLPRLVLIILQIGIAWFAVPALRGVLGSIVARPYDVLVTAVLYALVVTIVGFAGALVLKGLRVPSRATLVASVVVALLMVGLTLIPALWQPIVAAVPLLRTSTDVIALIGAILGFYLRR